MPISVAPFDEIQALDVVATDPEGRGAVTGIAVALERGCGAICLTSMPRSGVVLLPAGRLLRRLGVYRRVAP